MDSRTDSLVMCAARNGSVTTVLEIRSKCRMDKCPSIIILGQTVSDLLGHIFGEHTCAKVDVHQQIMKA